mgnify:CR=1 FL=1
MMKTRRLKILRIDERVIIDVFNWRLRPMGYLNIPVCEAVPADAVVERIQTHFLSATIEALISHPSFDEVPDYEIPPVIQPSGVRCVCYADWKAEVMKENNNDAPRWMDRPDRPGTWVYARIKTGEYGEMPDVAINLTQEEIDKGAPFVSKRVYGPIPEDK